jgi:outer membrane protein assembly factor BamD (BamD/ComL family)
MTIKKPFLFVLLLIILVGVQSISAQDAPPGLATGLREYQAGQFTTALSQFQEASAASSGTDFEPYADFWVARSLMALTRYDEAADAFDLFLNDFLSHPYREEAEYQRARLFYLSEQYEAAVQRFNEFLTAYPESDFSANALYWTGESLFALGRMVESRRFFEEVTEKYPTSYRVEAARYRTDIIDLELREDELLTLLQWSHEEYLASLDEFRQKELGYQEALRSYRDRLSTLAVDDFREEIELLNAHVAELETTLTEREAEINDLLAQLRRSEARADALVEISAAAATGQPTGVSTAPVVSTPTSVPAAADTPATPSGTASVQSELLSLKAAALELQQRLLQQGSDQ